MTTPTPKAADRIERYVERFFQRSGRTEWPEVRRVARALRLRQAEVELAVDSHDNLQLTTYDGQDDPLGDHLVETLEPLAQRWTDDHHLRERASALEQR